jgi:hypothetical protein
MRHSNEESRFHASGSGSRLGLRPIVPSSGFRERRCRWAPWCVQEQPCHDGRPATCLWNQGLSCWRAASCAGGSAMPSRSRGGCTDHEEGSPEGGHLRASQGAHFMCGQLAEIRLHRRVDSASMRLRPRFCPHGPATPKRSLVERFFFAPTRANAGAYPREPPPGGELLHLYLRSATRSEPFRASTLAVTSCPYRCSRTSTREPPRVRLRITTSSRKSGMTGSRNRI